MDLLNLSAEPMGKLYSWLPHDLAAERVVFLPDACPGKSPLPTGTAVLTKQSDWRKFAVSDCGCGMRLLQTDLALSELNLNNWDRLANLLRQNKNQLGDLGGGNHFLDALLPVGGGPLHFLIHTGSRNESGHVDDLVEQPAKFDSEFKRVVCWAANNRAKIHEDLESVFGKSKLILNLPHNTYELLPDGNAIIRKGSVHLKPGATSIIPSHMSGEAVLVRATEKVEDSLFSMSHGTGRKMSRGDCKPLADRFHFADLRKQILIPTGVEDSSLRTDGPFAYRDLDECLMLIDGYVEEISRFKVVGYMGHL
jgi:RNA-splicing ligase RtcB